MTQLSESLNIYAKVICHLFIQWGSLNKKWIFPKSTPFSFDSSDLSISKHTTSKTHCALNNWPICAKKVHKRCVKMWALNFYKRLLKNIFLYINGRSSKISSVHTYVMTRTVYFDCSCTMVSTRSTVNWTIIMENATFEKRKSVILTEIVIYIELHEISVFISALISEFWVQLSADENVL